MKRKNKQDYQLKTNQELKTLGQQLTAEIVQMRVEVQAGRLKNISQLREKKRHLAIIKTVQKQKEFNENSGR